jgi:hypothetical protein
MIRYGEDLGADRVSAGRHAPATGRNRDAIAAVLAEALPKHGAALEIASGTGEHAVFFANLFPALQWQPTDCDPEALASIRAWSAQRPLPNLADPLRLDAAADEWPVTAADAMIAINMVHISPWSATLGLLRGAARVLPTGGPLIVYGPFRRRDFPTAPTNEAFDRSLRERDPAWGLREVETLEAEASLLGLRLERLVAMPANNLTLVFARA